MWSWLDAVGVTASVTLVGHSLGALMAARAALIAPERVARLILLAPAQGYGRATVVEREKKLKDRLVTLDLLGPAGMAQKRSAAMLSDMASQDQVAFIESVMAKIKPLGYTQAAHMLSQGDLMSDVSKLACPIVVASGREDNITPVAACQSVAEHARVAWHDLGAVGHACALESAQPVNALLGLSSLGAA
jgi:pimeloyl-ACP methyl ester carboxylesterase